MQISRRTLLASDAALTALPCLAGQVMAEGIATSEMPKAGIKMFTEVGKWMEKNGPTIYDATDPIAGGAGWGFTGAWTVKGSTMYYHISRYPGTSLVIGGVANKVLSVKLYKGKKLKFTQTTDQIVITGLPETAPDPLATVVEIEVQGKPKHRPGYMSVPQPPSLGK